MIQEEGTLQYPLLYKHSACSCPLSPASYAFPRPEWFQFRESVGCSSLPLLAGPGAAGCTKQAGGSWHSFLLSSWCQGLLVCEELVQGSCSSHPVLVYRRCGSNYPPCLLHLISGRHSSLILVGEFLPGITSCWLEFELPFGTLGTAIFVPDERAVTSVCSWFLLGEQQFSQEKGASLHGHCHTLTLGLKTKQKSSSVSS